MDIRAFTNALRSLGLLHSDIEKISRSIETATAEYKSHQSEEQSPPIVNAVLHRPESEVHEENARATRHEQREARHEGRDRNRLAIESIGLGIAISLAIANIGLWLVTKQMSKSTADAAAAAKDQAIASKVSIESAVAQFHLDQRAWLNIGRTVHPRICAK